MGPPAPNIERPNRTTWKKEGERKKERKKGGASDFLSFSFKALSFLDTGQVRVKLPRLQLPYLLCGTFIFTWFDSIPPRREKKRSCVSASTGETELRACGGGDDGGGYRLITHVVCVEGFKRNAHLVFSLFTPRQTSPAGFHSVSPSSACTSVRDFYSGSRPSFSHCGVSRFTKRVTQAACQCSLWSESPLI